MRHMLALFTTFVAVVIATVTPAAAQHGYSLEDIDRGRMLYASTRSRPRRSRKNRSRPRRSASPTDTKNTKIWKGSKELPYSRKALFGDGVHHRPERVQSTNV